MPDCCAAANCKQSTDQSNVSFFRFPLDPERCKQWAAKCSRPDLEAIAPEELHRKYMVCSKHFDRSMICQKTALKCVLRNDAVPTLFDVTPNKEDAQSIKRKRTRVNTGEDPVVPKKTKVPAEDPKPSVTEVEVTIEDESTAVSIIHKPADERPEQDDPSISKAKETLKDYFKETLAITGFSINKNASLNPAATLSVNTTCSEKIDQKDVLTLGCDVMRNEIRKTLHLARFFSILLEDKINIEGKDRIPLFIRSITSGGYPQKHLLGFLPCDVSSDDLFHMLISEISNKWGLRMEHCRGFTYLSSGSMSQKLKDFTCRMLRDFPQVVLSPSEPYAFNLWLIRTMPMLPIQDTTDIVEEVAAVIRNSVTLAKKLDAKIVAMYSHIKGEVDRVRESCQNRWEYGTDAFQTMLDILEPLLSSIGEMCTSALSQVDADCVEELLKLKEKLKNFNFIITLVVLKNTLCCVSILNPSLRGIISISSTLQYTISNTLKLLSKHMQEIDIFHRKWFSDALGRAKKLGVAAGMPVEKFTNGDDEEKPQPSLEDYYRETLSKKVLQYLTDEVKRVLGPEMARILRWLSLVPSYMADHNFSIRKDKVADANLNNLARPDSFYEELGCWEVKWRHASKQRILPTSVFDTLKIPDIGFYPNIQSLLRVLGSIPCVHAETDVYGQYDMVLNRFHSYLKEIPVEKRLCNRAFVYVNQDVPLRFEEMVEAYVKNNSEILQQIQEDDGMEVQHTVPEASANDASKEDLEEQKEMTLQMEVERKPPECSETDKEALKAALQASITAAYSKHVKPIQGDHDPEVEYVTKSEMNEVLKVCEDVVRERILSEIGHSFYSLFIDRVALFGEMEYLPMFIRFVDCFDVMRLELLGFVEVTNDTEAMCEHLFDVITGEWHLDLSYCRGQAYLGSGELSYKLKTFACKVQEKHPLAICTYFSGYSFNTWWSRSVPVAAVMRAMDVLEETVSFFSSSPALEKEFDQIIAIGLRESYEKLHELQGTFCSSWLEKHDSYEVFGQILEPLTDWLQNIDNCHPQRWAPTEITRAKRLQGLIGDFDFLIAIVALKNASSFTKELSAALQKDHFSAASQLSQLSGIVATLIRVKTNIKLFHQNWFDEASNLAHSMGVQVKVPDGIVIPRDGLLKPCSYYKDTMSVPLVDHLINMVKDYFSDDHKEILTLMSLVPSSVMRSCVFESLKSKPPLFIGDLPDSNNFFTELSCWKVKWKSKVIGVTIPETIFQTLRLPLMQYFVNINTLLKIMCVLPSTPLEYCGEVVQHKMYQDYLKNTSFMDRLPCLAMLQVGTDFNRDLDKMVSQCLKCTPKTLEGICLDKESKTLSKTVEIKSEDDLMDEMEQREDQQNKVYRPALTKSETTAIEADIHKPGIEVMETQQLSENNLEVAAEKHITLTLIEQIVDENGHLGEQTDNIKNCEEVFKLAAQLARGNNSFINLNMQEKDAVLQKLSSYHWMMDQTTPFSEEEMLQSIVKAVRETILNEVQDSPFFSVITDRAISVGIIKFLPVFLRYVNNCIPKVELIGFLPLNESSDVDLQAKALSAILENEWGLQMSFCRGQSIMCIGTGGQSLRKMALGFLESYPLAVNTPSESCGLAYWLALSLRNGYTAKVLETAEDLLQFFDQTHELETELAKTMDGLLSTPREALAEVPETCVSRWKKREDFFDILVDMLEGVLNCLDSVSSNSSGTWSSSMSQQSQTLAKAIRQVDFILPLVFLKNACAPLRNCSTVFRCGNPADIICELEKIISITDSLSKMLDNVGAVHSVWFEEAVELVTKITGLLSYAESVSCHDSPEEFYMGAVSIPVLNGLIEEMKFNFSENHLKALKVLSLLPTCNPLPILPESLDKLHTLYLSDLPEPETAEEDINSWAAIWREKHHDVCPPTSISETLLHDEAKNLPNVSTLLKLVAVLPSISMECDLMKTTLNSLRTFLRDGIFSMGSKTDSVTLLMHRQTLQNLEELIEKCMEADPESQQFLAQVKARVNHLRMEGEVIAKVPQEITVDANGSDNPQKASGLENVPIQSQGPSEMEATEGASTISAHAQPSPPHVAPVSCSLPISVLDQPTESVQDAIAQTTTAAQEDSAPLISAVQDLNDQHKPAFQVTEGYVRTSEGVTEQSIDQQPVITVHLVSANQNETSPLVMDQIVHLKQSEQEVTQQNVPVQATEAIQTNSSEAAQDNAQLASEGPYEPVQSDQEISVNQSVDQVMEVDGGAQDTCVVDQPETRERREMKSTVSPLKIDPSVVNDEVPVEGKNSKLASMDPTGPGIDTFAAGSQGETVEEATKDETIKELFSDDHLETRLSSDEGPVISGNVLEAGKGEMVCKEITIIDQIITDDHLKSEAVQTGTKVKNQVVSDHMEPDCLVVEESLSRESDQLAALDSGNDQSLALGLSKSDVEAVKDEIVTDSIMESREETGQTENELANDQYNQIIAVQSEMGDETVTEQIMVVGPFENDVQAETDIPIEAETCPSVSEHGESDQIMVEVSRNDQSVTVDQGVPCYVVIGDQSVPDQFSTDGQADSDQLVNEGKNEAILTEIVGPSQVILGDQCASDQLMDVESDDQAGTVPSFAAEKDPLVLEETIKSDELMEVNSAKELSEREIGNGQPSTVQIFTDAFVEVGTSHTLVGQTVFADEAGTCQVSPENQMHAEQLVTVEHCVDVQSVAQSETIIAMAFDQSVPDEAMEVSQDETDQIVPWDQSEIDRSITVGQDQPEMAVEPGSNQFSSEDPSSSGQENEASLVHVIHPSEISQSLTEYCATASPEDITDHLIESQSQVTDHSEAKTEDHTYLGGTSLEQSIFTPYNSDAQEELSKELCDVKFFSIVAEEDLVIEGRAYIPVAIHYLDKKENRCEKILMFIPLSTHIELFVTALTTALIEKWGLNLELCRSVTVVKSGDKMAKTSALLSQSFPRAFCFPNPVPLTSLLAGLPEITRCIEFLDQLFLWFSIDSQRTKRLEEAVVFLFQTNEKMVSELKAKITSNQLAMSHEVLELSNNFLEAVVVCLLEIKENLAENAAQAENFLCTIQNFDFLLTVVVLKNILRPTKTLSLSLQGNSFDVFQAVNSLMDVLPSLQQMKSRIELHHEAWFHEAVSLASKVQIPSLQSPLSVHYKLDVSKEVIEHCIAKVEGALSQDALAALHCLQVVPYVMSKVDGCCKDSVFAVFHNDLPEPDSFQNELKRWKERWQESTVSQQHLPDSVLDTLKTPGVVSFTNISTLLRLLAVLPFSSMQSRQETMTSELFPL